jgi:oxygen-independent coproporphyrinogen-3 oxidase
MQLSAYIHIPFCSHKCDFCDFVAFAGLTHLEDEYCRIVCEEIKTRLRVLDAKPSLTSIFYGGGTPGLISPSNISKIHSTLLSHALLVPGAEVTLETTPQAIDAVKASDWLAIGINRLSVGVETLNDSELSAIGRDHTRNQAIEGLATAVKAGFENVSCDLMYGLPTQDLDSWNNTIQDLLNLAHQLEYIRHISAYALDLAVKSPLLMRFPMSSSSYPAEDQFIAMYELLVASLEHSQFVQYEISNFSKPGFQSVHNLNYWNNGQYLGFGVGAHRYTSGYRSSNWRSLSRYLRDYMGNQTNELINPSLRAKEAIMLGLRRREGIDLGRFAEEYGVNILKQFSQSIERLEAGNFIELVDGKLRLSSKGVPVSNSVIAEFI